MSPVDGSVGSCQGVQPALWVAELPGGPWQHRGPSCISVAGWLVSLVALWLRLAPLLICRAGSHPDPSGRESRTGGRTCPALGRHSERQVSRPLLGSRPHGQCPLTSAKVTLSAEIIGGGWAAGPDHWAWCQQTKGPEPDPRLHGLLVPRLPAPGSRSEAQRG